MKSPVFVVFFLSFLPVALSAIANPRLTNAKRLAQGLPPLRPRRLFNPSLVRKDGASGTTPPPVAPTSAALIRAEYIDTIRQGGITPTRRQIVVGGTVGYMDQFGKLEVKVPTPQTPYATGPPGVATYLYAPGSQWDNQIETYICLSNDHSSDSSRDAPVDLSPTTGAYVQVTGCSGGFDQPAGSPPTSVPADEVGFYGENRVWQVDPTDNHISFYYANSDGTVVPNQQAMIVVCDNQNGPEYDILVTANTAGALQEYLPRTNAVDPTSCYANELTLFFETS